jgi:hypothetical protein
MDGDRQDITSEVSADKLFSKFSRQRDPVVDGKIERLPLHNCLTPDNFERLIARLADPASGKTVRAFRYGKSGSKQGGIDVMVIDSVSHKCDYYEGKRRARISKGNLTAWVNKFLQGPHAGDARKFVLCTTHNVFEVTELTLEWKECAKLLAAHEIDGDLWDGTKIHALLRKRRPIVSELFGDDVADRYCVQEFRPPNEASGRPFKVRHIKRSGRSLSLQNVSISCEVWMPSDNEMSIGAVLSFARHDLSGISITISGRELVRWMQWRAHAQEEEARPYVLPMVDSANRVVLLAQSARLILHQEEIEHLDWALRTAWDMFCKTANGQLTHYRCGRFKRLRGTTGPFVLASVEQGLWQAMLEFAQEHNVDKGDGPWHMFDGNPGSLKVYSRTASDRFDSGYHAILYAYERGSIWLPWESRVDIGWDFPSGFNSTPHIAARASWDAEFTHDWLLAEFIPAVILWKNPARQRTPGKTSFWSKRGHQLTQQMVDISGFASSAANGLFLRTVPENFEALVKCIGALQYHFTGRRSEVAIEPALSKIVLTAIDRALTFAKLSYEGYLRSTLSISSSVNLVDAVRVLAQNRTAAASATELDFQLRGLLEVMHAVKLAPAGEWSNIAAMLQPLLDRYNEDIVCDFFTAE